MCKSFKKNMFIDEKLTSNTLSVHVLQPVAPDLFELEEDGIYGAGFQPQHAHVEIGEHPAAILGQDHLVGNLLKLLPQAKMLKVKISFHEEGLNAAWGRATSPLPVQSNSA